MGFTIAAGSTSTESAARTSPAARSPEVTAPFIPPSDSNVVSVPAQWIAPTGSIQVGKHSVTMPGVGMP